MGIIDLLQCGFVKHSHLVEFLHSGAYSFSVLLYFCLERGKFLVVRFSIQMLTHSHFVPSLRRIKHRMFNSKGKFRRMCTSQTGNHYSFLTNSIRFCFPRQNPILLFQVLDLRLKPLNLFRKGLVAFLLSLRNRSFFLSLLGIFTFRLFVFVVQELKSPVMSFNSLPVFLRHCRIVVEIIASLLFVRLCNPIPIFVGKILSFCFVNQSEFSQNRLKNLFKFLHN